MLGRMGEKRGIYRVLVRKHEGKRPPGRPKLRWENNIKMNLLEVKCCGTECIKLAQDRDKLQVFLSVVVKLRVQ